MPIVFATNGISENALARLTLISRLHHDFIHTNANLSLPMGFNALYAEHEAFVKLYKGCQAVFLVREFGAMTTQ